MAKALEHIKVLDVTQFEAGPTCTEMMAFLGAEVIKIEPPGKGDPARYAVPKAQPDSDSFYFISLNLNKKSITLDISKAKGTEIFKEMVKKADVVVENLPPGTMDKLGLGYKTLNEINSMLIYGSIAPFGVGPYGNYLGSDLITAAMSSTMTMVGFPDKPPVRPGSPIGETGAGVYLFGGIMAALHQRQRIGRGQFVEVSMLDTALNVMRVAMVVFGGPGIRNPMYQGEPGKRKEESVSPIRTKESETEDSYIIAGALTPQHVANTLKVIGREDLLGEERLFKNPIAAQQLPEYRKAVEDWAINKTAYEAFHQLAKARIPTAITLNTTRMMNDPHFVSRKTVVEVEHPVRGRFKTLASPQRLEKSPIEVKSAPLLGQDNEEVYASWLGYSQDDLAKLKEADVI